MSQPTLDFIAVQISRLDREIKSPFDENVQNILLSILAELLELEARHCYGPVPIEPLPKESESMEAWVERIKHAL